MQFCFLFLVGGGGGWGWGGGVVYSGLASQGIFNFIPLRLHINIFCIHHIPLSPSGVSNHTPPSVVGYTSFPTTTALYWSNCKRHPSYYIVYLTVSTVYLFYSAQCPRHSSSTFLLIHPLPTHLFPIFSSRLPIPSFSSTSLPYTHFSPSLPTYLSLSLIYIY